MTEAGTRVLAYCRQSQQRPGEDPTTSLSLNGQADRFRVECEQRGWVNLGILIDHDLKGEDPTRPGVTELRERCKRGDVDAVWVVSLNRFSNDYIWQGLTWRELNRAGVKHVISVVEGVVDDEFILGIHGLVSGKRIREMSVHLKNAFARRAHDGGFPTGTTPTGFRRPHKIVVARANGTTYERETGQPSIDPEGAELFREIADRFLAGDSITAITDDLARRGRGPRGGHWHRSTVMRMLQSPIYCGDIVHKGAVVAHNDEWAIISRDEWLRIQDRLKHNPVVRGEGVEHWLEGLVVHGCGDRMYFQRYAGKSRGYGGQYGCRTQWEPAMRKCGAERMFIGSGVLSTVTRRLLALDLESVEAPADALKRAQERAGGRKAQQSRARIERALAAAQQRWHKNHERFSVGKLKGEVMDQEDALLAIAEATHANALAALPKAPDAEELAARIAAFREIVDILPTFPDDQLRTVMTKLSIKVVISDDGARLTYPDLAADILTPHVLAVPRGGKGFR